MRDDICEAVAASIPGTMACAIVDLADARVLASHRACPDVQATTETMAAAVTRLFRETELMPFPSWQRAGAAPAPAEKLEKLHLPVGRWSLFAARLSDERRALLLCLPRTAEAAPAWSVLLRAVARVEALLSPVSPASGPRSFDERPPEV